MKVDVKTLSNGTRMFKNIEGESMHECQYCGTWFKPKRRFIQKFCSESCRVMACRKRKVGLYGTVGGNANDRNNVTNQSLLNTIEELRAKIEEQIESSENSGKYFDQKLDLIKTNTAKVKRNTEYQLVLSIILPFLVEPLKKKISSLFQRNDKPIENFEGFREVLEPLSGDIDEETKEKILNAVESFYKAKQNFYEAKKNDGKI